MEALLAYIGWPESFSVWEVYVAIWPVLLLSGLCL